VTFQEITLSFEENGVELITTGPQSLQGTMMSARNGVDTQHCVVNRHGKARRGDGLAAL
jgi:hypothetical protein